MGRVLTGAQYKRLMRGKWGARRFDIVPHDGGFKLRKFTRRARPMGSEWYPTRESARAAIAEMIGGRGL